jgi:hypothetical protein
MARNFADHFLVPLMIEVIRLAILHVKQPEFIEVGGAPLKCDVDTWTDRKTCTVSQHLGYGEKDMAANELGQGYQMLAKDPAIANMFGPQQRYQMLADIAKLKGFNRFQAYLNPNAPPPQPQPDPIKMQEVQAKQMVAQATVMGAQTDQYKEQRLAVHDQDKIELQKQQMLLKSNADGRTADRQDADTSHRIINDNAQLQLDQAKTVLDAHNQLQDRTQTAHDNHHDRLQSAHDNAADRKAQKATIQ